MPGIDRSHSRFISKKRTDRKKEREKGRKKERKKFSVHCRGTLVDKQTRGCWVGVPGGGESPEKAELKSDDAALLGGAP